jgi:prepilin-type N-terminal cleavage/methylation domain-containing protein
MKEMNKKGVTLLELIIVFVIIAIMAAFLAPGIGSWLPRYRLRSATRDIVSTMRTAQIRAISSTFPSSNNPLVYQVNFTAGTSYILQHTTGGVTTDDGAAQSLPSGITINTGALPGAIAQFKRDATCSGGSIALSYQKGGVTKEQKYILLNPATGKITIQ